MGSLKSRTEAQSDFTTCRYENAIVCRYEKESFEYCIDPVVQERELLLELNGDVCYRTTCSPWDIHELIVGYLFLQNKIHDTSEIRSLNISTLDNTITAVVTTEKSIHTIQKAAEPLFALQKSHRALARSPLLFAHEVIERIDHLEAQSKLFSDTGGVHAALLVDEERDIAWFEDIGRHNALDKLVGWCLKNKVDTSRTCLVFSGRMPYEVVKKVARAGISMVLSPGAPTSLSIDLAEKCGITLIGFVKKQRFNIYTHPPRVCTDSPRAMEQALLAV